MDNNLEKKQTLFPMPPTQFISKTGFTYSQTQKPKQPKQPPTQKIPIDEIITYKTQKRKFTEEEYEEQQQEPYYNKRIRPDNEQPVKSQYAGINYTYLLENADGTLIDQATYENIYTNVILRYHYPICMNITNVLTEIEKHAILTNEYEFVKTLIPENVKIYKIPRVIYDLLVIHQHNDVLKPRNHKIICKFNCYMDNSHKDGEDNEDDEDDEDEIDDDEDDEDKIDDKDEAEPMEKIENKMYETKTKTTQNKYRIKCNTYANYCKKVNEYHNAQSECIFELNNYIISYLNKQNINYKTPSYVDYMPVLHDETIMEDYNHIKLLTQTLLIETTQTHKRDKIMLFRGSADQIEEAVDTTRPNYGYSVSYNTSLLNGLIHDREACTYHYMGYDNFRHTYILNKFWYGDGGVEDNLFFIPPLHPVLQIYGDGEVWHARSKIFANSKIKRIEDFGEKNYFPGFKLPDFLKSTYEKIQMFERFKLFITKHRAQIGNYRVEIKEPEHSDLLTKEENKAKQNAYLARVEEQYNKDMEHHIESELFGGKKSTKRIRKKSTKRIRKKRKCKTRKRNRK